MKAAEPVKKLRDVKEMDNPVQFGDNDLALQSIERNKMISAGGGHPSGA